MEQQANKGVNAPGTINSGNGETVSPELGIRPVIIGRASKCGLVGYVWENILDIIGIQRKHGVPPPKIGPGCDSRPIYFSSRRTALHCRSRKASWLKVC